MHLWKDLLIRNSGVGCLDMGDQVRTLFVTRFREMHFIANPVHASFGAETSLGIIGRNDQVGRRPQIFLLSKRDRSSRIGVLFSPHLTQNLKSRQLSELGEVCCCLDCRQELKPVLPNRLAQFISRRLRFGEAVVFHATTITVIPFWSSMGSEPLGSDFCQTVEGMTYSFSYSLKTIEHPYRCQNMGRIGTLTAACFEQPSRFETLEHGLEKLYLRSTCDQASTKFAQDRKVKARIGQFEGESIFPVDTLLDRLGGLSIRQSF